MPAPAKAAAPAAPAASEPSSPASAAVLAPALAEPAAPQALGGGLKQRHLSMMALGGVIGAGLFVGSGAGIAAAGPAILISYVLAGALIMLVMRMLGEMAAAMPASGSFSVYAERALGRSAGFTTGWLYWALIAMGVAVEAIGAAKILAGWLPAVPEWSFVLVLMVVVTLANLASVGFFGEVEFWFAGIKVAAIVLFLGLGALAIFGVLPDTDPVGFANLTGDGGFLPNGWAGVVTGLLAAVFAFGGLEVVTIAAAESDDPRGAVARAVRTAVWRIALFYIGSMAVVVTLLPWDAAEVGASPYTAVLDRIGIAGAGQIMNVIVLLALVSAMNANVYNTSRMLFSLCGRGEGPRALLKLSRRRVPYLTVLASVAFGFVSVVFSFVWEDTVFTYMLNAVGAVLLVVWGLIAASQLRLRYRLERENGGELPVRMWGFPYLSWLALAGIAAVLVLMLRDPATREQVLWTAGLTLALAAVTPVRTWFAGRAQR
ncbi:amino acid permease [Yinghuangia soli]|uniref:Amino acid permease n=1 Tax=Yinghuangia soli TaxID=2908204 RepID=A0AA41Q7Y1_9ACTN|nr:amino acid permease [Yinghuangia soli]MCF2532029.1 amino acid permease [Yinghuangia soli]